MKKHLATFGILLRQALFYQLVPAVFLFGFYGFFSILSPGEELTEVFSSFAFDIFTLFAVIIAFRLYRQDVKQSLFQAQVSFKRLIALIPLSFLARLPLLGVIVLLTLFFGDTILSAIDEGIELQWSIFGDAVGLERYLVFISFVIVGPIHEELFFRGVVFRSLRDRYSLRGAVLISTTVFTLFHFHPGLFISSFILGLFLVYVYYKWNNLLYSIILHMLINAHPFILDYLGSFS